MDTPPSRARPEGHGCDNRIAPSSASTSRTRGGLRLGGIPVGEIAARYGTPCFVYDRQVLDRKWALLRDALPAEFSIAYSVKANPNAAIIRHFLAKGANLEIASQGEMARALAAGCPAGRILFAGPGKTEAELEQALVQGIGEIHVESALEARRIAALTARLGSSPARPCA